nr:hypothetical protein [uncultured Rhizobium sp.]
MISHRIKPLVIAAAVLAAFASVASAADRRHHHQGYADRGYDRGHRHQFVKNNRWDRQGDGRRNRPAEINRITRTYASGRFDRGSSSFTRGIDTYAGSIQAYSVPGNGTYFVRDDIYWPQQERRSLALAPKAKVIDVAQEMGGNAVASNKSCSFEAGVCVIRGGR